MLKLQYDGNDNISNEDGVIILKRARLELARKLSIPDNNARVLLIFESKEILDSLESAALRSKLKRDNSSDWTCEFCKLLENRGAALNLLLSLDDDSELKNYRAIIRQTFDTLKLPKRLEVIDIAPCPDGRQEPSDIAIELKEEESLLLPINPSTPERFSSIEICPNPAILQNLRLNLDANGEKHPVSHSHLDDIVSAKDFKTHQPLNLKNFLKKPTKQLKPLVFMVKITTVFIFILICGKLHSIHSTLNDISSKYTTTNISFTTEDTPLSPFETTSQKTAGELESTHIPDNQRFSTADTAFIDHTTEDTTLPPFETTSQKTVGDPKTTHIPDNQRFSTADTAFIDHTTEDTTLPPFETTSKKTVGELETTHISDNQRFSSADTAFIDHNVTISSGILFTTKTPPSVTISQKRRISQFCFNHPSQVKENRVELCDTNAVTIVNFAIETDQNWDRIRIDCPENIHFLIIEGTASTKHVDEILTQTSKIRGLEIQCNEIKAHNNVLASISRKSYLRKLKYLTLISQNATSDCSDVFQLFGWKCETFTKEKNESSWYYCDKQ